MLGYVAWNDYREAAKKRESVRARRKANGLGPVWVLFTSWPWQDPPSTRASSLAAERPSTLHNGAENQ